MLFCISRDIQASLKFQEEIAEGRDDSVIDAAPNDHHDYDKGFESPVMVDSRMAIDSKIHKMRTQVFPH